MPGKIPVSTGTMTRRIVMSTAHDGDAEIDWGCHESVQQSYWFTSYEGQLKGIARLRAQDPSVNAVYFICVRGGTVTQAEQMKVDTIVQEAQRRHAEIVANVPTDDGRKTRANVRDLRPPDDD